MTITRLGVLYLNAEHFADEANQTVGTPIIGEEMEQRIANRRNATSRLTPAGEQIKEEVRRYFLNYNVKVRFQWSIYAGCSCPCSPGFRIIGTNISIPRWVKERAAIFVREDGLHIRLNDIERDLRSRIPETLVGLA